MVYPYSFVNLLTNQEWIGLSYDPWVAMRKILSRLRTGSFPCLQLQQDFFLLGESSFGVGGGWRGGQTYNPGWQGRRLGPVGLGQYWRQGAGGCWLWHGPRVINGWTPERILVGELGAVFFQSLKTVRLCRTHENVCVNPEHLTYYRRVRGELQLAQGSIVLPPFLGEGIQQL